MKLPRFERLRALLKPRGAKAVERELAFHIEMATRDYIAQGRTPGEARALAEQRFGDRAAVARECEDLEHKMERTMRRTEYLEELMQDIRFAARRLRHAPAFTAVAVTTLALGIGATTAVFSLVNGVLLKPLPFAAPGQLVQVMQSWKEIGLETWTLSQMNEATYHDRARSFSAFAGYTGRIATVGADEPRQIRVANVTGDFFNVIGVAPLLGRALRPDEDAPGKNNVAVLTFSFWRDRMGSDANVVGHVVPLNGNPTEIVGVMGPEFSMGGQPFDMIVPLGLRPDYPWGWFMNGIARLRPGVTPEAAEHEITDIMWTATRENPLFVGRKAVPDAGQHLHGIVTPLREAIVGTWTRPLVILQVAVVLILLIAAANMATLLLSKGAGRARELALRTAMGASRSRVLRQLLTETLVLSLAGAAGGVMLAWLGVKVLPLLPIGGLPRLNDVTVNGTVLAFAVALSVFVGLVFGLVPALHTRALGLTADLNEGHRGSASRRTRRVHHTLVVAQLALSLTLLIGAGLVLRSVQRILALDLGFEPDGVTVLSMALPRGRYMGSDQGKRINGFVDQALEQVRAIGGVKAAGIAWGPPFWGSGMNGYKVEGHETMAGAEGQVITNAVAPGYFAAMRIPIDRGRDFSTADRDSSGLVVIIDEPIAKQFWPDGDAVGHHVQMTGDTIWRTIVGVAGAIRDQRPTDQPTAHVYFPYSQMPGMFVNMEVRTTGDPAPVLASVKHAIAAIDAEVPLDVVMPLSTVIKNRVADRRLSEFLLGGFAVLALLLAAVGVYGVMSLLVSSRDREFGIRLAVGAEPASLLRLVLRQGAALATGGVLIGLAGAMVATRWLRAMLYEVSPTDPMVFTALALLLGAVTLLACYAPSRRAAKSDPLTVLRAD